MRLEQWSNIRNKAISKVLKSVKQLRAEQRHHKLVMKQQKLNKKTRKEAMMFEDYSWMEWFT